MSDSDAELSLFIIASADRYTMLALSAELPVARRRAAPLPRSQCVKVQQSLELQTNLHEDYAKFYNHGEGPYQGLLLVESAY